MDLIEEIRRNLGFIDVNGQPGVEHAFKELRGSLSRALDSLSDELYSNSTHFLLEFIQNADDNKYAEDVLPTMKISLRPGWLKIECNETGFEAKNVVALCTIGASTKKNRDGYIGEKGIGFKAVFKVTDVVHVLSRQYSFYFDRTKELGMIAPIWTSKLRAHRGWTTFLLRMDSEDSMQRMESHLTHIEPSLLLFLRKLCQVEIRIGERNRVFNRAATESDIVLSTQDGDSVGHQRYLVVKHTLDTYPKEPKRENITQTVITLAFPLGEDDAPLIEDQAVFAFLPLRKYGFKFIIQGDFLLPSSREDILSDLPWNLTLRDSIPKAFVQAVTEFHSRPRLKFAWMRFLPSGVSDNFMQPAQEAIHEELKKSPIILCDDGEYRLPSQVLLEPYCSSGDDKKPLIPQQYLLDKYYVSSHYDLAVDKSQLLALGVENMAVSQFIDGISLMRYQFGEEDERWHEEKWHEDVCGHLRHIISDAGYVPWQLQSLRIIPLTDRTWGCGYQSLYFNPESSSDIPLDLGVSFVIPLDPGSQRYKLFQQLGIKEADPQSIATRIVDIHSNASDTIQRSSLLAHLRYLFIHRHELESVLSSYPKLWVSTSGDEVLRSSELYMDHPRYSAKLSLSQFLQAPFIAAEYMSQYEADAEQFKHWCNWLQDQLGINTAPRVIDGSLSSEFSGILQSAETAEMLRLLQQYWPELRNQILDSPAALEELRATLVTCTNGTRDKLEATFLRTFRLLHEKDLPFLPVPDADDESWRFLENLGVSTRMDGMYSLKRLFSLAQNEEVNMAHAQNLYKQLDECIQDDDNARAIRIAFKTKKLIYCTWSVPEKRTAWLNISDVVWLAPASVQSKTRLLYRYPSFHRFFISIGVPDTCPPSIFLDELKPISAEWRNKSIPQDVYNRVSSLLLDLDIVLIYTHGEQGTNEQTNFGWLFALREQAIFPVISPTLGLTLLSVADNFYLPDESGALAQLFSADVPLLATPVVNGKPANNYRSIDHILGSNVFRSHLLPLEKHVTFKTEVVGEPRRDDKLSAKYTERVPILRNILNALPLGKQPRVVFNKIGVYYVDSVETTFTLGEVRHSCPDTLTLDVQGLSHFAELRVMVVAQSALIALSENLSKRMAQYLNLEVARVHIALETPLASVETLFNNLGLTYASRADDVAQDEYVMRLADEVKNMVLASAEDSKKKHAPAFEEAFEDVEKPLRAAGVKATLAHGDKYELKYSTGAIEIAEGHDHDCTFKHDTSTIETAPIVIPAAPEHPTLDYDATYQPAGTNKEIVEGFGEYYTFEHFKANLPEFTSDNWTSKLRGRVRKGEPFTGEARAAITYRDVRGRLTEVLYGKQIRDQWSSAWPTYHMDIKTTEGGMDAYVFVTSEQFKTAAEMTITNPSIVPTDIYAIVRVTDLRLSSRKVKIFPDPHRLMYDRKVQLSGSSTSVVFDI